VPHGAPSTLRRVCERCTDMGTSILIVLRTVRSHCRYYLRCCPSLACRSAGSDMDIPNTYGLLLRRHWLLPCGAAAVMLQALLAARRPTRHKSDLCSAKADELSYVYFISLRRRLFSRKAWCSSDFHGQRQAFSLTLGVAALRCCSMLGFSSVAIADCLACQSQTV
jgi:hypothetical protein